VFGGSQGAARLNAVLPAAVGELPAALRPEVLHQTGKHNFEETVQAYREFLPQFLPLPHPSWRNSGWLKRHPWFEQELLPELRQRVLAIMD